MAKIVALLLVGLSVGLGNFAAAVAIGLGGVNKSLRLRIALVFGLFETGMPIVGLVVGHQLASVLGQNANIIGGLLLILTGVYLIISALRKTDENEIKNASEDMTKLLLAGLSLSIDNLIIGFSLGARHESLLLAAIVIGTTSVVLALLGLELGNRLSSKVGEFSEIASGLLLVLVGTAVCFKIL